MRLKPIDFGATEPHVFIFVFLLVYLSKIPLCFGSTKKLPIIVLNTLNPGGSYTFKVLTTHICFVSKKQFYRSIIMIRSIINNRYKNNQPIRLTQKNINVYSRREVVKRRSRSWTESSLVQHIVHDELLSSLCSGRRAIFSLVMKCASLYSLLNLLNRRSILVYTSLPASLTLKYRELIHLCTSRLES